MSVGPLVSVLTPVYNGDQYLEECIRSVLNQTYSDWEYIIVDNKSVDGTAEIAERFAAEDSRVRVVRATEFTDTYGNHNRAIRAMDPRSRYCKFVHADDWLFPECLERMIALAEKHPSVGLVSAFRLFDTYVQLDGLVPYWRPVLPGREVVRRGVLGSSSQWVVGSPSSLLFRADLMRQEEEFFDRTIWHSDTEAAFRSLMRSDLGFVHQVLTFTRHHPGALSSFTYRVNTFPPLEGKLLIRYGPGVLTPAEYRRAVRRWLRGYGVWLSKQLLKPSRRRQTDIQHFHRSEIDSLIVDAKEDGGLKAVLSIYRALLKRPEASAPTPAE